MRFEGTKDDKCAIGVYEIENQKTGVKYIGQTRASFWERYQQHLSALRCDRHGNKLLQAAWNEDGDECFVFRVVERLNKQDDFLLHENQAIHLAAKNNGIYNLSVSDDLRPIIVKNLEAAQSCTPEVPQETSILQAQNAQLQARVVAMEQTIASYKKDVQYYQHMCDALLKLLPEYIKAIPVPKPEKQPRRTFWSRIFG